MKCTIDRAGRFVIPKEIHEAAGLRPGVKLEVSYIGGQVVIEPISRAKLVRKGSLLMVTFPGAPKPRWEDLNKVIRRARGDVV